MFNAAVNAAKASNRRFFCAVGMEVRLLSGVSCSREYAIKRVTLRPRGP